jgi:uncharacterized protein
MTQTPYTDLEAVLRLGERMGLENLGSRLRTQVSIMTRMMGGMGRWHWENLDSLMWAIRLAFKGAGLFRRGMANAVDFEVVERNTPVRNLPRNLHGVRILHLTDLHIEGHPDLVSALRRSLANLRFDLVTLTGDIRYLMHGPHEAAVRATLELLPDLACELGVYAVLGNHDFVEMVPPLERAGIRYLLNEAAPVHFRGDVFWLVGVDDPHFYGTHDLRRAYQDVPAQAPTILLSHSPELAFVAAESHRPDLYLCGHTHAGQICLPGERMVLRNAKCPKTLLAGDWEVLGMPGYTSRGVGASGVPLRFNCRPEITLHTLVPAVVSTDVNRKARKGERPERTAAVLGS